MCKLYNDSFGRLMSKFSLQNFQWLKEQNLIPRMIDLLGTDDDPEKHNNISEFLCEIISNSRSFRRNEIEEHGKIRPVEDISLTLLQVLEDDVTTRSLLDIILSNAQNESCVVAGIRIVMKLLELENSPKWDSRTMILI